MEGHGRFQVNRILAPLLVEESWLGCPKHEAKGQMGFKAIIGGNVWLGTLYASITAQILYFEATHALELLR
jgi:hypothetical protein